MSDWTKQQLEEICKTKSQFRGMKLYGQDFYGIDLERVDLRSASCPYAIFDNCNCKFMQAEGANFTMTRWNGANLHRANLKDATLCDADMTKVKDFFGVTLTMECRTWKGLKLAPGFWFGFLFYGLLMKPPTEEDGERLQIFLGPEHYKVLHDLYVTRQM